MMRRAKPISPGAVMPALSGREIFILWKFGKIKLRIITNACPPKYIWVPWSIVSFKSHFSTGF